MRAKTQILLTLTLLSLLTNCKREKEALLSPQNQKVDPSPAPVYIVGDPNAMLAAMEYAHGSWKDLLHKKDVTYHYDYRLPNGKADVSTERYIFKTEASFGRYTQHDINAFPEVSGRITQFFNGQETKVMVDTKEMEDANALKRAAFLRRANYFWFVMPYKLNDKGTLAQYLGQEEVKGTTYDKIDITYDATITGKELNDHYILYINPETQRVDHFYFSLPAFGIAEPTILAYYTYTEIDGQQLATKRQYFFANEKGDYGKSPDIIQTLSQIKFNNGFTNENILK